jgi:hypothetical protein
MLREAIDHVLRAAAAITGHARFVLVGTGAAIALGPRGMPASMMMTPELDLFADAADDPASVADLIDGAIGQDSQFHRSFGYYGDGVSPETALLPTGWRSRATEYRSPAAPDVVALCPDMDDIALAKLCAWREKDRDWLAEGARAGLIAPARMRGRLEELDDPRAPPRPELERRLEIVGAAASPR